MTKGREKPLKLGTTFRVPPTACAHCGANVNAGSTVDDEGKWLTVDDEGKPRPGDVSVCVECGGLNEYTAAMGLRAADESKLPPEVAEVIARARHTLREMGYSQCVARLDKIVDAHLSVASEMPRFALPAPEIAIIGDLGDLADSAGTRMARNESARMLLASAVNAKTPSRDRPTVTMLRAVLEYRGVAVESVTMGELGLTAAGVRPAGPS